MKQTLLLLLLVVVTACKVQALSRLVIGNVNSWSYPASGVLVKDVDILVKPQGLYAQVEVTFSMKGNGSGNDMLESILNFDLPAGSFIHSSWLWLNDSTIIDADLIERNQALQIYNGTIIRKRDPSILIKTSANTYQLNVYPYTAATAFTRKVKITYSAPFTWNGTKACVPLPVEIPLASSTPPTLTVRVIQDNIYTLPDFAETPLSTLATNTSANVTTLSIPPSQYQGINGLTLTYNTSPTNGSLIFSTVTPGNIGYYQSLIQPAYFGAPPAAGRNINFLLDHGSYNSIYTFTEIKRYLRSFMLSTLSPADSFNIFYVDGNSVVKSFAAWTSASGANINAAINAIPQAPSNDASKYLEFFKQGLAFTQTRTPERAQTAVISSGNNYQYQSQSQADTFYNRVKASTGPLLNRISFINYYGSYYTPSPAQAYIGNQLLFSKFFLATNGIYQAYGKTFSSNNSNLYDLDIRGGLKSIGWGLSPSTSAYAISYPMALGFMYDRHDINGYNRLSVREPYIESGKFLGTISNTGDIQVQHMFSSNLVSGQQAVSNNNIGDNNLKKAWVFDYITNLQATNPSGNYSEILDSSLNNRVLCDITGFLALETGDTIKRSVQTTSHFPEGVPNPVANASFYTAYPNPFTATLTIQSTTGIDAIDIYDIAGRLVFFQVNMNSSKEFIWTGSDDNGKQVVAGVYIIRLRSGNNVATQRVIRQ